MKDAKIVLSQEKVHIGEIRSSAQVIPGVALSKGSEHEVFSEQQQYELNADFYKSNTHLDQSNSEVQFKVASNQLTPKDHGSPPVEDDALDDSLLKIEREMDEITRNSLSYIRTDETNNLIGSGFHASVVQPGRQGAQGQGQSKIELRIPENGNTIELEAGASPGRSYNPLLSKTRNAHVHSIIKSRLSQTQNKPKN